MRFNDWIKNAVVATLIFFRVLRTKPLLLISVIALAVAIGIAVQNQRSQKALLVEAAQQAEQEKLQREESDRAAQKKVEQEGLRIEENNRLAKIQEAKRQKQASENLATELKAYKDRYLDDQTAHYVIAVLIVNEKGQPNKLMNQKLFSLLNTNGVLVTISLFKPQFISDGLFAGAFDGSKVALAKLDLANLADKLLLGRQTVEYSTNAALENLVTARMKLELQTVPLNKGGQGQSQVMESIGAELNRPADAYAQAEERMIKQIETKSASVLANLQSTTDK